MDADDFPVSFSLYAGSFRVPARTASALVRLLLSHTCVCDLLFSLSLSAYRVEANGKHYMAEGYVSTHPPSLAHFTFASHRIISPLFVRIAALCLVPVPG